MSLAIEKLLAPATGRPAQPSGQEADQKLNIAVVFTSVESTLGGFKGSRQPGEQSGRADHADGASSGAVPFPLKLRRSWWNSMRTVFG